MGRTLGEPIRLRSELALNAVEGLWIVVEYFCKKHAKMAATFSSVPLSFTD
jgi:hypothetical protein